MAKKFRDELAILKEEVMQMGLLAGNMLDNSIEALKTQNNDLADFVISQQDDLSRMDGEIEEKSLKLLTLHQPMAKDLRTIACSLKMITYLMRVGRYGKEIAQVAKELSEQPKIGKLVSIPYMASIATQMIDDALNAYNTGDLSLIQPEDFIERDDNLDALRYSIFRECISCMIEDPKKITACANYSMIARYLERVGDHACKMAEKIHYMETAKRFEIR